MEGIQKDIGKIPKPMGIYYDQPDAKDKFRAVYGFTI